MCKTLNLIHHQKAIKDFQNKDIADLMTKHAGTKISEDSVQRYFSGGSGVPIEYIGSLLNALGLKVVQENVVTVEPEKFSALKLLAREALEE